MTFLKSKVLILVLISLSFTFADNSSRNVVYGNGRISSHPDSLYFHFASGTVSGNPTGMDVMITAYAKLALMRSRCVTMTAHSKKRMKRMKRMKRIESL